MVELKLGTVLYHNPAFDHNSPNFQTFLSNFNNLYANIKLENPFTPSFDGYSTHEGREIQHLLTSLGLSQVISELTNFLPNKKPSCIDLVITDQSNFSLDSVTRASLDPYCHHQIIYCKVNFRISPPPPLERKIWHFNPANIAAIKKSVNSFPWLQHLNLNTDIN